VGSYATWLANVAPTRGLETITLTPSMFVYGVWCPFQGYSVSGPSVDSGDVTVSGSTISYSTAQDGQLEYDLTLAFYGGFSKSWTTQILIQGATVSLEDQKCTGHERVLIGTELTESVGTCNYLCTNNTLCMTFAYKSDGGLCRL